MTNETERKSEHKQSDDKVEQFKKNPSPESGKHQQDSAKRNPSQGDDSQSRSGEGSDQLEKRRA